jgi:hypothetical protein
MFVSHVISDAALAITGVGVFWTFFGQLPFYNRLLWGFFLLIISLAATAGAIRFAGFAPIVPLHESLQTLASTLGITCVVMAVWAFVMGRPTALTSFVTTVVVGLVLFVVFLLPNVRVFTQVVAGNVASRFWVDAPGARVHVAHHCRNVVGNCYQGGFVRQPHGPNGFLSLSAGGIAGDVWKGGGKSR